MKRYLIPIVAIVCLLAVGVARAADPVKVDSKHYTVEFENDVVRILRIHYGPGEKSVMHDHPAGVAIYLTDAESLMTTPDGKSVPASGKAGAVVEAPAGSHLPQNTGKKAMELLLVEFKEKPAVKK